MEIKHVKVPSLFSFFLKYLIVFCLACLLLAVFLMSSYFYAINFGLILPANAAELQLKQGKEQLERSEPFDASLIPFSCTYALLDKNGTMTDGNMNQSTVKDGKSAFPGNGKTASGFYFLVERKNGYCLVSYDISSHFASPTLHRIVPKPELLLIVLLLGGFFVIAIATALHFRRKLEAQLASLIAATSAIKEQDLTFQAAPTRVKEFNVVLDSIEDMKHALKTSLEQQWNEEQQRRTQMAALTHDMKTPLTLVKGNAELLLESELQEEPHELLSIIHHSAEKMDQYIALLMDTAMMENMSLFPGESFSLKALIAELSAQAEALCLTKQLCFTLLSQSLPATFYGDRTLIFRGVMNLLDNAVEYSPLQGELRLCVRYENKKMEFIVEDQGAGFSAAALKQATTQFYTQQARSGKHYGMGLFLAKSLAEKYGGALTLANKAEGGAIVSLTLIDSLKQ